ncbi:MAG: hypothetical protein KDI19_02390 [Pseudomonadales bacterium]|nr:hypothetical protein [Pseudomonadales bacterium]
MKWMVASLLVIASSGACAEEAPQTIYLDDTVIEGNQELPRVLYIVPWQQLQDSTLAASELAAPLPSVLHTIDPEEFRARVMRARTTPKDQGEK